LPYEVTEPGYLPRVFYVPARVLNRLIGKVGGGEEAADSDLLRRAYPRDQNELKALNPPTGTESRYCPAHRRRCQRRAASNALPVASAVVRRAMIAP
jgi:hypothetical protein